MTAHDPTQVAWIADDLAVPLAPARGASGDEVSPAEPFSPTGAALACLEVTALPMHAGEAGELPARIRFWETVWPLIAEAAVEFRWLACDGGVRAFVLVRCSGMDRDNTTAEVLRLTSDLERLLRRLVGGIELVRLTEPSSGFGVALPFEVGEGGDLLRKRIGFETAARRYEVPVPLKPFRQALHTLIDEMVELPQRACVSLAATPVHVDELSCEVLEGELAQLERRVLEARRVADSYAHDYDRGADSDLSSARVEAATAALAQRIGHFDRLGKLRISVASEGPMSKTFRAAAQAAIGWSAGSLEYVPAAEPADLKTFASNLCRVGFDSWGVMTEEDAGRRHVSDGYLASLSEIASGVWLPPLSESFPGAIRVIVPVPRRVPSAVPTEGAELGVSLSSARERAVALSDTDRSRHMWILGQTGTGKSTLTARMALHDIHAGKGVCVIDPHGDLVDDILDRFPEDRADELIVFDPCEEEYPIGLNLFEAHTEAERDFAIQQVISILYRLYDPLRQQIMGPRFEHMLRCAALTVMSDPAGGTFLDIPLVFTNARVRDQQIKHVKDPVVRSFWLDEQSNLADFHKAELLSWFVGKWGAFLANATMRRVLGQRRSALDFRRAMDEGRIVLIKLEKGQIGEINARLLGMILVSKIQMATLSRAELPPDKRKRFHLYVDEFQALTLTTFDEIVAEARKYGLALTLANQHLHQLPDHLRMALFGNVGALCVFRLSMTDAKLIGDEFVEYGESEFTRLENYRCIMRTSVDGRVQAPFDVCTLPLEDPERDAAAWRAELEERSRKAHGTPAKVAEEEALRLFRKTDDADEPPV